jgi:anti-sigma factor RsiW
MHDHDRHLTDQELLLTIDRELPSRRLTLAAAHLAQCADCRKRRAQIDRAGASFVAIYQRDGAPEPGRWEGAREQLRSQMSRDSGGRDRSQRQGIFSSRILMPRWVTIGAALATAVLLIRVVRPSPTFEAGTAGPVSSGPHSPTRP